MQLGRHISGQFNSELESIRSHVLAMGGLVEQQLSFAVEALFKDDEDLARKVIQADNKVNQMEVFIDEACTRIIAKRQPTAKDLRLIMAIIKTISDLERIGDVAMSIAKTAMDSIALQSRTLHPLMEPLTRQTMQMLHEALDAFARMDAETAVAVYHLDENVNYACRFVVQQFTQLMMETPTNIPYILQILAAARSLERVGDRCKNICEYIIYFVKGQDVRHLDAQGIDAVVFD